MPNNKVKSADEMNTYIALFRGINVGGRNILPMKALSALLVGMGCENVKTYIQSGNVVFQSHQSSKPKLSKLLAEKVSEVHGFEPKVLLLEVAELSAAIANNPFSTDKGKLLHFFFLEVPPESPDMGKIKAAQTSTESYELIGSVFYFYAPDGVSRSKLFAKIEKCLGVPATARNWNTVNKLSSMTAS